MEIKHLAVATMAMSLLASSALVQAQPQAAVTARHTNLRAGPAPDYPVVAVLPAGFAVGVQGCLPDYTWCDVIAGQSRGWMWAGNINYYYQNSYVPLLNYGPVIGIGALTFFLGDYWGSHYRDRPFYRDRDRWEHRNFVQPSPRAPRPQPGFVPRGDRPGFVERGAERGVERRSDTVRPRRDSPTRPAEVRPRAATPPAAAAPNSRPARERQRDLNHGGSSSVDPRLRPQN
jgi:uncharacterized protein YraI